MTAPYFGGLEWLAQKTTGSLAASRRADPLLLLNRATPRGGRRFEYFRARPSASEPALPEAEPGQPAPADVQAQDPWHQEHRRSAQPEHSSSGQPGHSRSEPELRKSGHRPLEL